MADAHAKQHDYHLVDPSPWPIVGSVAALVLAVGLISWMHKMYAAAPVVFAAGAFTAREPLVRKFLEPLAEGRRVTDAQWRALNWWWVGCYGLLGGLNLLVARSASERVWVNFKVFGLTAALLVFLVLQTLWLQRRPATQSPAPPDAGR